MSHVTKYLGVFLLWNLVASLALLYAPPVPGLVLALLISYAFLWAYLLRYGRAPRRWVQLRLRPLDGETTRWLLLGVPVLLLCSWALGEVWVRLAPVPPESFNPFEQLMRTAVGRLAFTLFAIGVAPVLEEFFFRGLVQHSLERRLGAGRGIAVAAALFAAIHLRPWVFPLHFFLGAVFGYAVYATRSIWAGVLLHAANNTAAVIGLGLQSEDPQPVPTLWETGPTTDWWLALAALLLSLAAGRAIVRKLHLSRHLRPLAAGG